MSNNRTVEETLNDHWVDRYEELRRTNNMTDSITQLASEIKASELSKPAADEWEKEFKIFWKKRFSQLLDKQEVIDWIKENLLSQPDFSTITGWKEKEVMKTFERMKSDYNRLEELEKQIGEVPEGSHPDERKPRAETWLKERTNWQCEVEALREKIKEQELIIYGLEEGCDEWKLKCTDLLSQLKPVDDENVKNLQRIRNYFGEHDKTTFEHWAYTFLNNFINKSKPFCIQDNRVNIMTTFYERMIAEKTELDERRMRLFEFLNSENRNVDAAQWTLLRVQECAMRIYSECLAERLALLKSVEEAV